MPPDLGVLIPLGGMATGALVLIGIYRIWVRTFEQRHRGSPDAARDEVDRLRHELSLLHELPGRVAELEERLDFAERLLAREERSSLPRPD